VQHSEVYLFVGHSVTCINFVNLLLSFDNFMMSCRITSLHAVKLMLLLKLLIIKV